MGSLCPLQVIAAQLAIDPEMSEKVAQQNVDGVFMPGSDTSLVQVRSACIFIVIYAYV